MSKLNKFQALKILEETQRRKSDWSDILEDAFPEQRAFIEEKSKFAAALCTRRAGKSYSAGLRMVKSALEFPGTKQLYIALTRQSAKDIITKDVLDVINARYRLKMAFNAVELLYTFPNGSTIKLMGMNASPQESQKALGQKYKLVIIDEAGSFTQDLEKIIMEVLRPAVADLNGQIVMIGTPQNVTKGFFYKVTNTKEEPGWAVHKWTWKNNLPALENIQRDHDDLVKLNPRIVETPGYQQHWLGMWVIDTEALVYRYSDALLVSGVPHDTYTYILGLDLGYEDDTAFTVVAYSNSSPILYVVDTFKKSKMDLTDVAEKVREFEQKYRFTRYIVDGAAKQAVEELKKRHSIPLVAAEKHGKADFIEIVNSEMIKQNVRFVQSKTRDLVDEMRGLIWDARVKERSGKKVEHPSLPNHLCDSFLYAFRESFHYLGKPAAVPIQKGSQADVESWWDKESERLERKSTQSWWEQ